MKSIFVYFGKLYDLFLYLIFNINSIEDHSILYLNNTILGIHSILEILNLGPR